MLPLQDQKIERRKYTWRSFHLSTNQPNNKQQIKTNIHDISNKVPGVRLIGSGPQALRNYLGGFQKYWCRRATPEVPVQWVRWAELDD